MKNIPIAMLLFTAARCFAPANEKPVYILPVDPVDSIPLTIAGIELPEGYNRVKLLPGSFGDWLRKISLKKDKRVYLYNGSLKNNQSVQYAVLDKPIGNRNLQQCADAIIRLRAEWLFDQRRFDEIEFRDNNNKSYRWTGGAGRPAFERWLENVFGACGSASLEKQLKAVADPCQIEPGDVFIKGGFPGHAMIVTDMAINAKGEKIFMLAQGFMPAQDIHIVKNPSDSKLGPWYSAGNATEFITPQWTFYRRQLKRW